MLAARWVCLAGVLAWSMTYGAGAARAEPAPVYTPVHQGTPHSALFGLDFDGERGVAVGLKGEILESNDAGTTWKPAKSPTRAALLAVAASGGRSIAVGLSGVIVTSTTGEPWKLAASGVKGRLLGVDMDASGLAVAVGAFGTVIVSRDGGNTWQSKAPDWSVLATPENPGFAEPMVYGVAVGDAGAITLVGEFGLIARSNDGGDTWHILATPRAGVATLNAIYLGGPGQYSYAVGQEGTIRISSDGGETWTDCTTSSKLNFLGVAASPTGEVIVTGMRVMYRSRNNGMSWEEVTSGDARSDWYLAARAVAGSNRMFAVGHSGRVIAFAP